LSTDDIIWGNRLLAEQWRTMLADYTNVYTNRPMIVTDMNRQAYGGAEERTPSMESEQERIMRELEELGAKPRVLSKQVREQEALHAIRARLPEPSPELDRQLSDMIDELLADTRGDANR
jgi:hypothetical protein